LGRVLVEFADKAHQYFTHDHLREAVLLILSGLFWPQAANLSGPAAWQTLIEAGYRIDALREQWYTAQMPALSATLIAEAWEQPPRWTTGLYNEPLVNRYLLGQALLQRVEMCAGDHREQMSTESLIRLHDLWGYRQLFDSNDDASQSRFFDEVYQKVDRLATYKTPVEEKYAELFEWWALRRHHPPKATDLKALAGQVQAKGYDKELALLEAAADRGQLIPIKGDSELCPGCYMYLPAQTVRNLRAGHLATCPNCHRAVLYWMPALAI
jgi:hypothetical protein